ncbi:MFS transporter [Terriglobus sp. RCC_193]|uniref:MFS transporter n=1 Tax=Terriglobus sp. RCC_193 TaxID=3239218 RepID=UPI003523F7C4
MAYSTEQLALYRRISLRVAPLALLLYLVAFLDRVNVSFAALTMNHDLGISETTYGLAAGVFFLGYMVLAIPSNYMIVKVGAPRWVALLMITWGIVGCATAFVHGAPAYITLRFLLGAAESGFLPGLVYYLTRWLPGKARAGILALLYLAIPLSSVIGSPISAALLRMNGMGGLHGWQWLFLLEAIPAIVLGCAVPWLLDDGPHTATWLSDEDKQMLRQSIEEEASVTLHATGSERAPMGLLALLAATYFMLMIGLYELGFWTPRLIASHGVSLRWLGWLNALPYAVGAVTLLPWCRWSDRIASRGGGRQWILAASFLSGCAGFVLTALAPSLPVLLVAISIAAFGVYVSMPVFWAGVSQRVSPAVVAFAIALINSIGNIGGFLGPYATGWLLDRTHSYAVGLTCTAAALFIGTVLVLLAFRKNTNASTLS